MTNDDSNILDLHVIDIIVLYQSCKDYLLKTDTMLIPKLDQMIGKFLSRHVNIHIKDISNNSEFLHEIREIFSEKINHHFIRLYNLITEHLELPLHTLDIFNDDGTISTVFIKKDFLERVWIDYEGETFLPINLPVSIAMAILNDMTMAALAYLNFRE